MKIQVLIDNPSSWINDYKEHLKKELIDYGCKVNLIQSHEKITNGDILVLLSCEKKLVDFEKNKHNLVVHASDLPKGKGWSPLSWQVLQGINTIPVVIFEAESKIDNGAIYDKVFISLDGSELIDNIRQKLFKAIKKLVINFVIRYPNNKGIDQLGDSTFYRKRNENDSKLNIDKSLKSQFNLLRIVDNERYPAYFILNDKKYLIKVYSDEN